MICRLKYDVTIIIFIGIRVGDYIVKINDTPAENLTLLEAQTEIQESGRHLRLYVKG